MAADGRVAPELAAELPGLRLRTAAVTAARPVTGRAPRELRDRLRALSNRFSGARAVELRREAVPSAHRVLFRHVGLDPDVRRPPLEAAVLDRLVRGGFPSGRLLDDALLVALLETGVAVWALDAARVDAGGLELRADAGGALVVADAGGAVARLFDEPAEERAPTHRTRALLLYAIQPPAVPDVFPDEALWTCAELLGDERVAHSGPW